MSPGQGLQKHVLNRLNPTQPAVLVTLNAEWYPNMDSLFHVEVSETEVTGFFSQSVTTLKTPSPQHMVDMIIIDYYRLIVSKDVNPH